MDDYQTAVVAIVERSGEVLIGRKADVDHFLSGCWHVPGGRVEPGETDEGAVIREMAEEAGITVEVSGFLDEIVVHEYETVVRWFVCRPLGGGLRPGDDLVEVEYVTKEEAVRRFPPDAVALFPPRAREYFGI